MSHCGVCKAECPAAVVVLSKVWVCEKCKQGARTVMEELDAAYSSETVTRMLYISDKASSLDKVKRHYYEGLLHTRSDFVVTLCYPSGLDLVSGKFQLICCDNMQTEPLDFSSLLAPNGRLVWVEPETLRVYENRLA